MNRTRLSWIVLGIGSMFVASGALADGVVLNGTTARSIGRGGTNLAHRDNGGVLFDNPAAAVNIDGYTMVDVGANMILNDFYFANPRNRSSADDSLLPLPEISLIRRSNDGRVACGLGVFAPAGFCETYDLEGPPPFLSGQQRYKSFGSLVKVLPSVAFRANDRLSFGATFGAAISHDELEGPYFIQSPGGPVPVGTPMLMDLQATGAAMCWSFGLQYELTEATTLGLAFQSESRFRAEGSTRVWVPGMGPCSYDSRLDITWPESLGLGVRHEIDPCRVFSTDVIWYNWSGAFDDLGIHLINPSTLGFPALHEQLPLRWRDTVSVRLGYERTFAGDRVIRCGYVYHRNPIPNGTLTPFIQATMEHAFSLGYGWTWRSWNVDLSYMFAFGPEVTVGTSDIVGGDFNNSVHRAQTHALSFSFLRRF
ncbi:MAG: outer membrane protein transport protein [Pirellulales bacterium]|nr:outer membrane protein transport protein [Pirellulales bacterium]